MMTVTARSMKTELPCQSRTLSHITMIIALWGLWETVIWDNPGA